MKILLIEPAKAPLSMGGEDIALFEPLALEYLASGVAGDNDVRILDMRLESDLFGVLEDFAPDVVGITSYTVHVNTVMGVFERIKGWNPYVLSVVGGHHATVRPTDFISPFIDLVVSGEGVFAFREIINRFESGEGFHDIPGVSFMDEDTRVTNAPLPLEDLDALPIPDRELTSGYRKRYYSEWMKPLASIRTSKGCPHRCSFCAQWKLMDGRYLRRKPERVVEELAGINEDFVFFADDESLIDKERMRTLAGLIKEAGIKKHYFLYGRSDTIARNPDLLETWKEIGLERIFVGVEFFRDEDLQFIKKGSTIDDNERAIRILRDLDIQIFASFIVRPEYETEDFASLRKYCRHLDLNFAGFTVLTPLPGTDLYEEVKSQLITRNYDYFDFMHTILPTALPIKEFYKEYTRLFRRAIPSTKQISFLKKYKFREIPFVLATSFRFQKRLKTIHLDY